MKASLVKSTKNTSGGMSAGDVAKALGMTRQNVRRIEKQALRKLYFALKDYRHEG